MDSAFKGWEVWTFGSVPGRDLRAQDNDRGQAKRKSMVPHPEGCLAVVPRPPLLLLLSDINTGTSLTITETTFAKDSGCPPA